MSKSKSKSSFFHKLRGCDQLEARYVLAANPIITEFMASNGSTLLDEDGDSSDWIEVYNAGDESLNLAGWHLTDDADELDKWRFPSHQLNPGDFLVVFASDKDRALSNSEFHTNFKLSKDGEYLALVEPDGGTVAFEFAPEYVAQESDVSYGVAQQSAPEILVDDDTSFRYIIPDDSSLALNWTAVGFDDSGWNLSEGTSLADDGLGYENTPSHYAPFIDTPVQGGSVTVYARYEFDVADPSEVDNLVYSAIYDDGFIAYLNGTRIEAQNAPQDPDFDSSATSSRGDLVVIDGYIDFNVSQFRDLLQTGNNVLAVHALNRPSSSDMLFIPRLEGLNTSVDVSAIGFLSEPTPGAVNSFTFDGFVDDVDFSVDHGFFTDPFQVTLNSPTANAKIVYTTDGSDPSAADDLTILNGTEYTGPIPVSETGVVRATAFKSGFRPSTTMTETYVFPNDVVDQDFAYTISRGFPNSWGGTSPDYGVDVTPGQTQGFIDGLTAIPTISLSLDQDDLFNPSSGIYTNSTQRGRAWERPVSVEYIDPNGGAEFHENAGLRIQGGAFRSHGLSKKHSLRLVFRREYGAGELEFDLFGGGAVESFDTITLRMDANDGWAWNGAGAKPQYARDEFGRRAQLAMGQPSSHGSRAHVYLNGVYWGLYNPVERPDADFSASYYGGDADDWDAINSGDALDGNLTAWNTLVSLSQQVESASTEAEKTEAYYHLQGLMEDGTDKPTAQNFLDVDNYIDYLLVNFYGGNSDWPFKNYYMSRERGPDSTGFKFHMWDAEWSLGLRSSVSTNKVNDFRGVAEPYGNLRSSLEFQTRFGDRAHRALFHDGPLTTDNAIELYQSILDEIDSAIDSEAGRWGDQHFSSGYNRTNWLNETSNVINNFLSLRTDRFVQQLRSAGLYPAIDAVSWNQRGGNVTPTFDIELSAPQGTIYYTLDGTDPREIGGTVGANAVEYIDPINLPSDATITARVLHNGQWSAVDSTRFDSSGTSLEEEFLQVVEIHYHPTDATESEVAQGFSSASQFEFIELLNTSTTETLDLQGVAFTNGIVATFTQPTPLLPQARALVVSDLAAFTQRYGQAAVNGVAAIIQSTSGQLSNGGETLTLTGPNGEEIFSVEYDDDSPWTTIADGVGSLQLVDETNTPPEAVNKYYSWRNSYQPNGTPGAAPTAEVPAIVINELLTRGDVSILDAIELYNSGSESVDVSGWFLSDNSNDFSKFEIPDGTIIEPGEVVMFDERDFNDPLSPSAFGLSSLGEEVWLTMPSGQTFSIVDSVEFGASFDSQSLGRYPDGRGRLSPMLASIGSRNAEPIVWSVGISEFNFHPANPTASDLTIDPGLVDDDLEFVEIHNASATPVDLTGWTLSGEIDYEFESTILPGRESLVVVSFSPDDTTRLTAFQNHYAVGPANFVGPFAGHLSNNFGLLALNRPGQPEEGVTPIVAVDELVYDDTSPWPTGVDGEGASLHRLSSTFPSEDASSWIAITPSPGMTDFFVTPPPQVAAVQRDEGQSTRPDRLEHFKVGFDSSVSISTSALTVTSAQGDSTDISAATFSYDDEVFIASWELNTVLSPGVYEFALVASEVVSTDGNAILDGNGNGQSGSDFVTSFYVAIPGDANLDMTVDVSDFNRWNGNKFCTTCRVSWFGGDFNGDGVTDVSDFNIWNGNKFTSVAPLPAASLPPRSTESRRGFSPSTADYGLPFRRWNQDSAQSRGSKKDADSLASRVDRIFADETSV